MPEYESSTHHMTPADRWAAIACFIFFLVPTVGSYMAFGGGIWLSRLLTYATGVFFLAVLWAFIDARRQAAERRPSSSTLQIGEQNWFWSSDCDPGRSRSEA